MARAPRREMAELLSAKEMIVVCGSGGTGKTTIAAALGAQAAATWWVAGCWCSPSTPLAGWPPLSGWTRRVARSATRPCGCRRSAFVRGRAATCRGELWVAMLDTKAGWDDLIRRHAPDAQLRDTVLANPLYQNITGRFVNSHDYLAMERLYDLHASGRYDLVVIDTPPSRNALDLLDAPGRMKEFFGSRLLRSGSPCRTGRGCSRWPRSRSTRWPIASSARVPAGHRRVLRALPDDGEGVRRSRRRGRAVARRPAHLVRRGVHARGRAGVRGGLPRRRAAATPHAAGRHGAEPNAAGCGASAGSGQGRRHAGCGDRRPAAARRTGRRHRHATSPPCSTSWPKLPLAFVT
jgi:hypothetical protein